MKRVHLGFGICAPALSLVIAGYRCAVGDGVCEDEICGYTRAV
ncbi:MULTISPECIES: hypothetical protein [unclassified Serratia (in: enterobacteria)]|nr:hypothetical protein [Serratia sp. C2(2)]MEE4446965.1 hypothetical protein [Serratia sp. C2(1)]